MQKTINYCWFGYACKNETIIKCIDSWKKFCPDYEIKEWNELNFDINCCDYVKEAYENKKWAFVSDYCRFWVLYNYGGIYLDTDVELIRSLDDLPDTFVGFENDSEVNSGLIRGANKNDKICEEMLLKYHHDNFVLKDKSFNLQTVCDRETRILEQHGLKRNGSLQTIMDTTVFPIDYFCPMNYDTHKLNITENTYSIHHYMGSWTTKKNLRAKIYSAITKIFGKKFADKCRNKFGKKNKH